MRGKRVKLMRVGRGVRKPGRKYGGGPYVGPRGALIRMAKKGGKGASPFRALRQFTR